MGCLGFQALIQYQVQQCAASARTALQVLFYTTFKNFYGDKKILRLPYFSITENICHLLRGRVVTYMMGVVSWISSSQSMLCLLTYLHMLLKASNVTLLVLLLFALVLYLTLSFIFSLEELQVNYNNDRSRYGSCVPGIHIFCVYTILCYLAVHITDLYCL